MRQTSPRHSPRLRRTLLSGDSLVDRFRHGEVAGLSTDARQGLWLFESRGGCWRCHSDNNLTDGKFHNTGVGNGTDPGHYAVTRRNVDRGAFQDAVAAECREDGTVYA